MISPERVGWPVVDHMLFSVLNIQIATVNSRIEYTSISVTSKCLGEADEKPINNSNAFEEMSMREIRMKSCWRRCHKIWCLERDNCWTISQWDLLDTFYKGRWEEINRVISIFLLRISVNILLWSCLTLLCECEPWWRCWPKTWDR